MLCRYCRTALDYQGQLHPCLDPFEKWKVEVDVKLKTNPDTGGMGLDDLPDLVDLHPLFRQGVLPGDAAVEIIETVREEF